MGLRPMPQLPFLTPRKGNPSFNNEVQHFGEQKGNCYPKCIWKKDISILVEMRELQLALC